MKTGLIAAALFMLAAPALAEDTIKIANIDAFSGGGSLVGEVGFKHFKFIADKINAAGGLNGKKIEMLAFDGKANPQESLIQAQKAADQGIRIFTEGNGSAVAAAISGWVTKYNERNPGKEIVFLNYGAIDPALTNDKCAYWHFRFDANTDMKLAALTTFMKDRPSIKKVYLINQDYSFGQSVQRDAHAMLKEKRPDIEIVGDELVPLFKVTDFSPYIAKIKASGADSVITGNWGQDFALLVKAAADAGLQTDWYTTYAGLVGGPTAIRQTGLAHRVFQVSVVAPNSASAEAQAMDADFRAKFNTALLSTYVNDLNMLAKAIKDAKADDAKSIAAQLDGMKDASYEGGDLDMRKDDHQLFQNVYVASFGPLDPGAKFDEEGTGWGWKTVGTVKGADTMLPTTCKMERP